MLNLHEIGSTALFY